MSYLCIVFHLRIMAGIYIHIPFCASRCSYCDFFSTLRLAEWGARYVEAVIAEARLRCHELRDEAVTTLYLGGGTPSQLPLSLLARLVNGLTEVIDLGHVGEFTVVLELIGRRHNAAQVTAAINSLRENGINNISIDLIYGLPGQTVDSWTRSVEQAVALKPQHISAYGLTYEEGTKLWHQRERGEVIEVPEEQCLMMYRILVDRLLQAGFDHYEISNFALPGYYSRHNSSYWNDTPYLGLGAAAHSYDGRVRRSNPCDLRGYVDKVMMGESACEVEELTTGERYDERVMLGLRTSSGVDAARLREDFGDEALRHFMREAQPHIDAGHLRRAGDRYVLTGDGIMLSDSVMRDLLWDE